mmetsp:Transcript_25964/g.77335  ORF Transcript_25964/g.77335 Transcript_25964/m.77335 type:complete len:265 (-) Transcript_25964:49-843(-)
MALLLELGDLPTAVGDAVARVQEHRAGMQRDVRARPRIRRRREVVGVGLASDLKDRDGELLRHLRRLGEPLGLRPGLDDLLRLGVAGLHLVLNVVVRIEHEEDALQRLSRGRGNLRGGVEGVDQGGHVVAALHHAEELHSLDRGQARRRGLPRDDRGEEVSLRVRGVVHARRHAVCDEVKQEGLVPRHRLRQQGHDRSHIGGGQRQGRDARLGALVDVGLVLRLEAQGLLVRDLGDLHHDARLGLAIIAAGLTSILNVRHGVSG